MSVKRAFFSIFQKIMVICCAMFFCFFNAFSANLPSGYQQVEYIESTGTQWIDTGYIPNITDTLTTVIKSPSTLPTSGVYYLYGTRDAYKVNGFVIQLYKNFYLQYGDKDTGNLGALVADTDYTIVQKGPTYSVNGDSVTVSGASTPVLTRPLYLFTVNNGGEVHGAKSSFRLYSFTAKSSDSSYKMNLVPAKDSSGVVGMYDTVGDRFYTNQGTGSFTAGPVVLDQCRNLFDGEYISVSNGAKAENKNPFYVTPGKKYTISWSGSTPVALNLYAYDSNNTLLYSWTSSSGTAPYFSDSHNAWYNGATFTVPENVVRLRFNTFGTISAAQQASWAASLQIEEGDTATAYVPYSAACHNTNAIKIATTAYNTARFNPVKTDLDNAVATIREIVTKTINQTAAIASLQADKQTRPEDACPAGKKCLLVETEENGVIVPHWFPIIEAPTD